MLSSRTMYGSGIVLNYHLVRGERKRKYATPRTRSSEPAREPVSKSLNELDLLDLLFEARAHGTDRLGLAGEAWRSK